jgi:predicted ribosomally synthesized peptide with SipW-like signal peptide
MPNEFNVSRRKVLAGLGTIGIASAGAGLGTTAFFSDEESLEGSLEAGKIDLKLDYRSTYVPGDRETPFSTVNDTAESSTIPGTDLDEDGTDDRVVLDETPSPVYTPDDVGAEGSAGNGLPSIPFAQDVTDSMVGKPYSENDWGTLTDSLDCQADTSMLVDGEAGVVVDLEDVKPKDEGEFTISLHHCDNRAYLWMQAEEVSDLDNGLVEPEIGANDSDGRTDGEPDFSLIGSDGGAGELDDFMYVEAWYDLNCNNIKDETVGPVDITLLFDITNSMVQATDDNGETRFDNAKTAANAFIDAVAASGGSNARVGLLTFGNANQIGEVTDPAADFSGGVYGVEVAPTNDFAGLQTTITNLNTHESGSAGTGTGSALEAVRLGSSSSDISTDYHDFGDERADVVIVLTDGEPNRDDPDAQTGDFLSPGPMNEAASRAYGVAQADALRAEGARVIGIGIGDLSGDAQTFVENVGDDDPANYYFTGGDPGILDYTVIFESIIAELERSEVCIYRGSLAGFLEAAQGGIAIDPSTEEDFTLVAGEETAPDALCVLPGVNCIAVRWYLPCFYTQDDEMGFSQLETSNGTSFASEIAGRLDVSESDLEAFDVINLVQTDSVEWVLRFAAIQCRHNMENRNPYFQQDQPA